MEISAVEPTYGDGEHELEEMQDRKGQVAEGHAEKPHPCCRYTREADERSRGLVGRRSHAASQLCEYIERSASSRRVPEQSLNPRPGVGIARCVD